MFDPPFMAHRAIVALDIGVLLGLARLDLCDGDTSFLSPLHHKATDIFGASISPNVSRLAAPFDDLVQAAQDAHGRQRKSTSIPSLNKMMVLNWRAAHGVSVRRSSSLWPARTRQTYVGLGLG